VSSVRLVSASMSASTWSRYPDACSAYAYGAWGLLVGLPLGMRACVCVPNLVVRFGGGEHLQYTRAA